MATYEIKRDGDKITLEEQKKGCGCNLVILDAIIIMLFCISAKLPETVPFEIHPVFRIMIGLALSTVLFLLLKIKFVGTALNIVLGLLYVFILYILIDDTPNDRVGLLTNLYTNDPILWWTIIILSCLFFIGLHLASSANLGLNNIRRGEKIVDDNMSDDSKIEDYHISNSAVNFTEEYKKLINRRAVVITEFNNILDVARGLCKNIENNNELITFFESVLAKTQSADEKILGYIDLIGEINESTEHKATIKLIKNNIDLIESYHKEIQNRLNEELIKHNENVGSGNSGFSLFAGCDTVEKLKKRYKELSKNYHPDTDSGDKEAMQIINSEYDRLLEEFKSKNT